MKVAFNRNVEEGIEGVPRLPEDRAWFFEQILGHMRGLGRHYMPHLDFSFPLCPFKDGMERSEAAYVNIGFEYIEFGDKYDICEASDAVGVFLYDNIQKVPIPDIAERIPFTFNRLHEDSEVLGYIAGQLARDLCMKNGTRAKDVEELLKKSDKAIGGHVMKEFLSQTVVEVSVSRKIEFDDDPIIEYEL